NGASSLNFSNVNSATILVRDLSGNGFYTNGIDFEVIPQGNGVTGLLLTPGSSIAEGSTNLVDYQYSGPILPTALTLSVSNDVRIEAGGSINVDGRGFGPGQGLAPGRTGGNPPTGGGAGHGGTGGAGAGFNALGIVYGYDSLQQPTLKGSG